MDEENRGSLSRLSVPVLLVLTALAGGLFSVMGPLQPSRPASQKQEVRNSTGVQDVDARLWQDPFEALAAAGIAMQIKDVPGGAAGAASQTLPVFGAPIYRAEPDCDINTLLEQVRSHFQGWNPPMPAYRLPPKIPILLSMVSGGSYAEDVESRIRSRVAVVSGLNAAGYRPEDEEQIGYFTVRWGTRLKTENKHTLETDWTHLVIPYEWFTRRIHSGEPRHSREPANHVLVLWLRDTMFADDPLFRLHRVLSYMRRGKEIRRVAPTTMNYRWSDLSPSLRSSGILRYMKTGREFPAPVPDITEYLESSEDAPAPAFDTTARVAVLGPRVSSTLRAFFPLAEWDSPANGSADREDRPSKFSPEIAMYSWAATTMPELFVAADSPKDVAAQKTGRQILRERMGEFGIDFNNVTCTDDQLAEALWTELALRGCNPCSGRPRKVALVSEWDTFYGRTIPLTFAWTLSRRMQPSPGRAPAKLEILRGNRSAWPDAIRTHSYLRGIDGITTVKAPAKTSETKSGAGKEEKQDADRAEGVSQLDYIPRLAEEMMSESRNSFVAETGETRAIGLVGSDPYDKLLLLQALKPRFPNALFFTTDLDARFWHPKELRTTRNLIVASSFGLHLTRNLQKSVPPFRDSYQTAQYLACLAALGVVTEQELTQISPRIFEIGRNGPVELGDVEEDKPSLVAAVAARLQARNQPPEIDRSALYPVLREPNSRATLLKRLAKVAISALVTLFLLRRMIPVLRKFLSQRRHTLESEVFISFGDIRDQDKFLQRMATSALPGGTLATHFAPGSKLVLSGVGTTEGGRPSALSDQARTLLVAKDLNRIIRVRDLRPLPHPPALRRLVETIGSLILPPRKFIRLRRWLTRRSLSRKIRNREAIEKIARGGLYTCERSFATTKASLSNFARFAWIPVVGFAALIALIVLDHQTPSVGEPFSWSNGVSSWPSQIIRFMVLTLSFVFVGQGIHGLRMNDLALSREFELPEPPLEKRPRTGRSISPWMKNAVAIRAKVLWQEYRWLGKTGNRCARVMTFAVLYIAAVGFLASAIELGDEPLMPLRGKVATSVNLFLLYASVLAFTFLNFFVVDAARLCRRFIQNLSEAPTVYPPGILKKTRDEVGVVDDDDLDELIDMKLIAGRSAAVSRMIYAPFVALFLMILARARFFDDWPWPIALIFIFSMNAAWAVSSALVLQSAAKSAKSAVLKSLRARWVHLRSRSFTARAERIDSAIREVEAMKSGAFAGFTNNPILGALSLPLTGSAIAFLVEFLSRS